MDTINRLKEQRCQLRHALIHLDLDHNTRLTFQRLLLTIEERIMWLEDPYRSQPVTLAS